MAVVPSARRDTAEIENPEAASRSSSPPERHGRGPESRAREEQHSANHNQPLTPPTERPLTMFRLSAMNSAITGTHTNRPRRSTSAHPSGTAPPGLQPQWQREQPCREITMRATRNSDHAAMNENNAVIESAGAASGNVTFTNASHGVQPSISAACSSS